MRSTAFAALAIAAFLLATAAVRPAAAGPEAILTVTNLSSTRVHIAFHQLLPLPKYFAAWAAGHGRTVFTMPETVHGIVYASVKLPDDTREEPMEVCLASLPITVEVGKTVNLNASAWNFRSVDDPRIGTIHKADCKVAYAT